MTFAVPNVPTKLPFSVTSNPFPATATNRQALRAASSICPVALVNVVPLIDSPVGGGTGTGTGTGTGMGGGGAGGTGTGGGGAGGGSGGGTGIGEGGAGGGAGGGGTPNPPGNAVAVVTRSLTIVGGS